MSQDFVLAAINRTIGYKGQYYHPHSQGRWVPRQMADDLGLKLFAPEKHQTPDKSRPAVLPEEKIETKPELPKPELPDQSWTVKQIKGFMDRHEIAYEFKTRKADLLKSITDHFS